MALYFIQQGADLTAANSSGENVFMLTEEYLPKSMTANVLSVKKNSTYQDALALQEEKLAEVKALEQQLAEEEARVKQLQEEAAAKAQEEAAAKEAALRAKLEEEYQAKTAEDPELVRLQQQLEAAKAQREAAMQEEIDRQVAEQLGKKEVEEPSVLKDEKASKK